MRLDRKVPIRGLDEIAPAYATDFVRHQALVSQPRTEMLNDGIREHDVVTRVIVARQIARVAGDRLEFLSGDRLGLQIEQRYLNVSQRIAAHGLPESLSSANVEQLERTFDTF